MHYKMSEKYIVILFICLSQYLYSQKDTKKEIELIKSELVSRISVSTDLLDFKRNYYYEV